jgi:uncharacterized protein (DUF2141 family)
MTAGRTIIILCLAFVVLRCAKQTTPTGGPKDETPPKLLSSTPAANQVNYNKSTIELTFDELVQVNNPKEQLLIVPSVGKKFEVRARKNKVFINLNTSLDTNTTYLINFRECIQDLNERNTAKNIKLAFSTGDFLDSLKITGQVTDLLKGLPQHEFTVAAIPQSDTLDIFRWPPTYMTKTGKDGAFSLENLKPGSYHVYAFDDANSNLIVDSRTESFGFLPEAISLTDTIAPVTLQTVWLDMRPLRVNNARPQANQFLLRLSKGIASYQLKSPDSSITFPSDQPEPGMLRIYKPEKEILSDSIQLRILAQDSIAQQLDTLVYVKFNASKVANDKFTLQIKDCRFEQNKGQLQAELLFSKPTTRIQYDSIFIRIDSVQTISFSSENLHWKSATRATINKKLATDQSFSYTPPKKEITERRVPDAKPFTRRETSTSELKPKKFRPYNQLIIAPPSFISVEGDTLPDNTSAINILKPETTGTILVQTKSSESIIIQLLNKKFDVLHESTHPYTVFDNLTPGDYILRAFHDRNKNGKWDPGNWYTRQPPENIFFYKDEKNNTSITLKANWELGPLLITY